MTLCNNLFIASHLYIYHLLLHPNSMPHFSKKECTYREIYSRFIRALSRHSLQNKTTRQLLRLYEDFVQQRYMYSRLPIPKSNWANHILPQYNDDHWREVMQMDLESFEFVIDLIKDCHIFHNQSTSLQASIEEQLKVALYKLTHNCSASGYQPLST